MGLTKITSRILDSSGVTILGTIATGVWQGTDIAVLHGGTGASTAGAARTNLGLVIGTHVLAQRTFNDTNWDNAYTDRLKWDGGATGLTASTGRTSLGLGTVATTAASDYATAAQGTKADTAHGWGNHTGGGYVKTTTDQTIAGVKTFSDVLTAQSLRTSTSNTGYNLISREGSGGVVLYVQGDTGGSLLDVRFGSTTAGSGTRAFQISGTGHSYFGGNVGIGTNSPFNTTNNTGLNVDTGGHSSIMIGDGINDGGMIQSSDNSQRIIIGANVYDDPSSSWTRWNADGAALIDIYGDSGNNSFISLNVDDGTSGFPSAKLLISSTGLATFKSSYIAANQYGGELTVGGSSTDFGIAMKYNQGGATSGTIYCSPGYTNGDTTLKLGTGSNTNQLVLKGDGKVGIGTSLPDEAQLAVFSSTEIATGGAYTDFGNLHVSTDTQGVNNGGTISMGGLGRTADSMYFRYAQISGRAEGINGHPEGYMAFETTSGVTNLTTERMRLNSSGHLGIGTTSPAGKLELQGSGQSWTTSPVIRMWDSSNSKGWLVGSANNATAGDFYIRTLPSIDGYPSSGQQEFTIKHATGNVGIGTYSPGNIKLNVYKAARNNEYIGRFYTNTGRNLSIGYDGVSNNTSYGFVMSTALTNGYHIGAWDHNNSGAFFIYNNGNIENQNNSYGQYSDIKLKENVVDASPKLDDLLKVKVKNFNFIGSELKQIGVIAQELEEVFPGLVEDKPDTERDEVTNQITELETTTKSVKYSVFTPMLIKAIQEQQAQIELLKQEVELLKQ